MVQKKAWYKIISSNRILLVSHVYPDGDTIGSVLALYLVLKQLKKKVKIYNPSKNIPRKFSFLPNFHKISNSFEKENFDLVIYCDCASVDRANTNIELFSINIDHHKTNTCYANINIINEDLPSASLVVYDFLMANNVALNRDIALCLYVAFVEDSGFFTHGNLNSKVLQKIAHLVSFGVDMNVVAKQLKYSLPLSDFRLKEHIYSNFSLLKNATISTCIISTQDLQKTGCKIEDTKDFANLLLKLASVNLAILVVQKSFNIYKISLRTKGNIDVGKLVLDFGGGGHEKAAGFECEAKNPNEIVNKIINKLDDFV